ncbi:MAG: GlxA family transcriptional regulator [Hyphomonadaceae bacterium]
MPAVGIIAPERAEFGALGGVIDMFERANRYTVRQYGSVDVVNKPSDVLVLTARGRPCKMPGGRELRADAAWSDAPKFDLIYVAAYQADGEDDVAARVTEGGELHAWLNRQREAGALLAASGPSVFHLAEAGVLDDQVATAPWWLERLFARRYPRVTLDVPRIIAEGDAFICTGTTKGEPALALRMAERVLSANVGSWLAKVTLIDPYPDGPAPWSVFSPRVIRQDGLVGRAQHWLQQRFSQRVRMSELADFLRISERTLERRFQRSLGMTPLAYLQLLRIEAAKHMLARSNRRVDRVAQLVGYGDAPFFKQVFREHTGLSPREYRQKGAHGP